MASWTREAKAAAVARATTNGESPEVIAEDIGAANTTVRRWITKAQRQETPDEKALAQSADEIAELITAKQAEARHLLIEKIVENIPNTDNLRDLAWCYGVITDKALLAAGKPTSIHGQTLAVSDDASADELNAVADELQRRRQEHPVE